MRTIHHENLHVGFFENFPALLHAERIERVGRLVRDASGIDKPDFSTRQEKANFHEIARRAGNVAHEDAVLAQERVHQARLARIRGTVENRKR